MRKSEVEQSSVSSFLNYDVSYEVPKPGLVNDPNITSEDALLFWKEQLDNVSPLLALPVDFPRSSGTSSRINHVFFSLSDSCWDALIQLNDQLDTNFFDILLAGYNT